MVAVDDACLGVAAPWAWLEVHHGRCWGFPMAESLRRACMHRCCLGRDALLCTSQSLLVFCVGRGGDNEAGLTEVDVIETCDADMLRTMRHIDHAGTSHAQRRRRRDNPFIVNCFQVDNSGWTGHGHLSTGRDVARPKPRGHHKPTVCGSICLRT